MSTSDADDSTDMETLGSVETINGTITARSPLHHGGDEKTGNQTLLRRQKMYLPERDDLVEVPYIAGNAVRGHLRRLLVEDLVERVDYTWTDERIYHAFNAGGILQKGDGSGEIDVGLRRELRDTIPVVNVFGMSIGNQMLSSVVDVRHMLPICEELNGRLGTDLDRSVHEFLDFEFHTRSDDAPDDTGMSVDFTVDENADDGDDDQSMQMKYEFEVFVSGTPFHHGFKIHSNATELDAACLVHGLRLWDREATVGGMAAQGYGEVGLSYDIEYDRGDRYTEYVADNEDAIVDMLSDLARK